MFGIIGAGAPHGLSLFLGLFWSFIFMSCAGSRGPFSEFVDCSLNAELEGDLGRLSTSFFTNGAIHTVVHLPEHTVVLNLLLDFAGKIDLFCVLSQNPQASLFLELDASPLNHHTRAKVVAIWKYCFASSWIWQAR